MSHQRAGRQTVDGIAKAIAEKLDGLCMDDPDDRRRMAEWIAANFQPKPQTGHKPPRHPSGCFRP